MDSEMYIVKWDECQIKLCWLLWLSSQYFNTRHRRVVSFATDLKHLLSYSYRQIRIYVVLNMYSHMQLNYVYFWAINYFIYGNYLVPYTCSSFKSGIAFLGHFPSHLNFRSVHWGSNFIEILHEYKWIWHFYNIAFSYSWTWYNSSFTHIIWKVYTTLLHQMNVIIIH